MKRLILLIGFTAIFFYCQQYPEADYNWDFENVTAENGMVASASPLASEVGAKILENGGNAVDAAVGTMLALNVVEPNASGIGGGGFLMIRMKDADAPVMIDYRETAPADADVDFYYDENTDFRQVTRIGHKAVCIPGSLKGYEYALEHYGTMTLAEILEPVIELAENGFVISEKFGDMISNYYEIISSNAYTSSIFLNEGLPRIAGETLVQKDLAGTFKLLAENGVDEFYSGAIAENIAEEMKSNGGYISKAGLQDYNVKIREPFEGTYHGYDIFSAYVPSGGGMQIIQILNILEHYNLKELGHNSPEYLHLLAEVFKQSFADRYYYVGDTDFIDAPLDEIVSKEYAKEIAGVIDTEKAKYDYKPYNAPEESESTSHLSVIDKEGNIVAATQSINTFFGSGVAVPGRGFLLNNHMNDFDSGNGKPNSIAPNKRAISSMAPTIILKDGKPFLTVGTPGATRIVSALVQIIVNIIDFDMSIDQAIEAPRMHCVRKKLYIEGSVDELIIEALKAFGHDVDVRGEKALYFGGAQGIVRDLDSGKLIGGADSRRDGFARGY